MLYANKISILNDQIDILKEKEKLLDEKLEIVRNKNQPCNDVQNVLFNKMIKDNSQSYVLPSDYSSETKTAIIPTVMVRIEVNGIFFGPYRAMLDTGAHPNLISHGLYKELKLPVQSASNKLVGINGKPFAIKYKSFVNICTWYDSDVQINDVFWILPKDDGWQPQMPSTVLDLIPFDNQSNKPLADPDYFLPRVVQILLGTGFFAKILISVVDRGIDGTVWLETELGIVIFGAHFDELKMQEEQFSLSIDFTENEELDKLLCRLWEMDQIPSCSTRTKEQDLVEQHFVRNHVRNENGIFIVKIPLKSDVKDIGNSKQIALRRFMYLERKLEKEERIKEIYLQKMRKSIELGHLQLVTSKPKRGELVYYIPHHRIEHKDRIVYDASCRTDKGISLNDVQMIGEKLQKDLHETIMRLRRHKIAVCADIKKMFNQVRINTDQWNLMRIFWRENRNEPLKEYCLTVVTFGLSSSPFLAVRCLIEAARQAKRQYPEAAKAIENDYYMDDCSSGASSVEKAIQLGKDMYSILKGAGFDLCQWKSNSVGFMNGMKSVLDEDSMVFPVEESSTILGLKWLIRSDQFTFEVKTPVIQGALTKRKIVSCVAKLYDPNGYISPVTIAGRIISQDAWRSKVDWDGKLLPEIEEAFHKYWCEIVQLEQFRIDRWLGTSDSSMIQIHGFSDAAEPAYGATVYVRIEHPDGPITSKLVMSKARVAPLKTVSIPRLELAAAELLARLLVHVRKSMEWTDAEYYLWSDSTVTLHWLTKEPCNLKTFVANRVSSIRNKTDIERWHYVNTRDNPADLLSRGTYPSVLVDNKLWLHGPEWLVLPKSQWPCIESTVTDVKDVQAEMRVFAVTRSKPQLCIGLKSSEERVPLMQYTNCLEKLLNIISFMIRFVKRWTEKPTFKIRLKRNVQIDLPTLDEKATAMSFLLRKAQEEYYQSEITTLQKKLGLPDKSKLESLHPYLDSSGMLRVGGRLDRSDEPYEMKHPAIIPNGSRLAWLVLDYAHRQTKHGGAQIMMQFIRQKYWIPKLRSEARSYLHKCVVCVRYNKILETQLMSELPADRVHPGKPFLHSGVDYAGPFKIKTLDTFGQYTFSKYWAAIFVCLKTKAVHIDVVPDSSSIAFIACYERFIGRRGRCEKIYSDNGTAFVGADSLIKKAVQNWLDKDALAHMSEKGTEWRFMVPAAPHQGGIYEAAVKSMKFHLKRTIGPKNLTLEQFTTLLVQIEAILNSRPIHQLSDDPQDIQALTPGHFLVGEPLVLPLPFTTPEDSKNIGAKLWRERQIMLDHIWKRWSKEYLSTLQERKKWRRDKESIRIGQLVVLMSENFPPAKWALGRIVELITSNDGRVRSAMVKTQTSVMMRPVQKLCILPVEPEPAT